MINLIVIGHLKHNNNKELLISYESFMIVISLFGLNFIFGMIKLNKNYKYHIKEYVHLKSLIFLLNFFTLILCLLSKFLHKLTFDSINPDFYSRISPSINIIYFQYVLFIPLTYIFNMFSLLNIRFFQVKQPKDKRGFFPPKGILEAILLYFIVYVSLILVLVFILKLGIYCLILSQFVTSLLTYVLTNNDINDWIAFCKSAEEEKLRSKKKQRKKNYYFNFFIIPRGDCFNDECLGIFKAHLFTAFNNYIKFYICNR